MDFKGFRQNTCENNRKIVRMLRAGIPLPDKFGICTLQHLDLSFSDIHRSQDLVHSIIYKNRKRPEIPERR